MLRIFLVNVLILSSLFVSGQTTENLYNVDFSGAVYSRHYWRGAFNGKAASVQPTVTISKGKLSGGIWAGYNIDNSYREVNLFASYAHKNYTISLYDYYCPKDYTHAKEFLDYNSDTTKHTFDLMAEYRGDQNLPVTAMISTFVFGDDLNKHTNRNFFSSYVQFGYYYTIKSVDFDFFTGFTPFKGYYSERFDFINVGLSAKKVFVYSKTLIPVKAKLAHNPKTNEVFFTIGLSIEGRLI